MTLAKPTGLAVGDLLVLIFGVDNATAPTMSGWTTQKHVTSAGYGFTLYTKTATAADVAATNFTITKPASTCDDLGLLSGYTNVSPTAPVDFVTSQTGTTNSCTHVGGTVASDNSLILTMCSSESTPNTPAGFTSLYNADWATRLSDKLISAGTLANFTSSGASTTWVTLSIVITGIP